MKASSALGSIVVFFLCVGFGFLLGVGNAKNWTDADTINFASIWVPLVFFGWTAIVVRACGK